MLMIFYAEYDMICLHKSLIIVLRWYESFFVLRYNDNVISKSWRNHDVIDIVTRIVCIMRYESSNRETIFFQLIQYDNVFNQLIIQFNRGQKPSNTLTLIPGLLIGYPHIC